MPADEVNRAVVEAMAERGVDIAANLPKKLSDAAIAESDVVITMGCGDACPVLPGTRYLDWELNDPAGKDVANVRLVRDRIEQLIRGLMDDLDLTPQALAEPSVD
jgi:arsenate reductase